jgi:hypothetical protein
MYSIRDDDVAVPEARERASTVNTQLDAAVAVVQL